MSDTARRQQLGCLPGDCMQHQQQAWWCLLLLALQWKAAAPLTLVRMAAAGASATPGQAADLPRQHPLSRLRDR